MQARFGTFLPANGERTRRTTRRRRGVRSMSEKQTQAYLFAREALRRIRRTSELLAAPPNAVPDPGGRSEAAHRLNRGNS
jgi:hypothetical protein